MADLAERAVVETIELPDGRRLLVYDDGRELVVGRAVPYPHPVPGFEWRTTPAPRPRSRSVSRRWATPPRRPIRILPDARELAPAYHRIRVAAERRAEALLESLLQPEQLADWRRRRHFWVDTPQGAVRLGELYRLVHHPIDEPGVERVLCVVPTEFADLPRADIWSNLLLVLAVDPDEFFRVAIEHDRRRISPRAVLTR